MAEGVGADRAEVRLTAEQVCDAGVIADSHTNLLDNVLLYDDIAEIDDIEIAGIAEIEIADIAGDRAGDACPPAPDSRQADLTPGQTHKSPYTNKTHALS